MQIELETQILSAAIFFIVLSFGISVICFFKQRRYSKLLAAAGNQANHLAESMANIRESSDQNSRRLSEQSRHIAWLETRIRQPKMLNDDILNDQSIHETPKATMTERRHRVITLASRGQNAEMIAAALGMLQGEVELIMSLNRAAARYKAI
jgi:DNA-binding NarL/FixJ family response regulator